MFHLDSPDEVALMSVVRLVNTYITFLDIPQALSGSELLAMCAFSSRASNGGGLGGIQTGLPRERWAQTRPALPPPPQTLARLANCAKSPTLDPPQAGDRALVVGPGAQAVDRLRGERHQAAGAQVRGRPGQVLGVVSLQDFRSHR